MISLARASSSINPRLLTVFAAVALSIGVALAQGGDAPKPHARAVATRGVAHARPGAKPKPAAPRVAAPRVAAPRVAVPRVPAPAVATRGVAVAQGGSKPNVAAPAVATPAVATPSVAAPLVAPPSVVAPSVADADIVRYCGNLAPTAAEARVAYQTKQLTELEARIKQQLERLEAEEARTSEWVSKRDALMKTASEDVVAIYAKMSAEAGAAQIATMDDAVAVGILSKLNPRVASAILGEMDADRAAKLTSLITGPSPRDNKS